MDLDKRIKSIEDYGYPRKFIAYLCHKPVEYVNQVLDYDRQYRSKSVRYKQAEEIKHVDDILHAYKSAKKYFFGK